VDFINACEVADEFSSTNYQPAPDGFFTFQLINGHDTVDYDLIHKMKIEFSGSFIPFRTKDIPKITALLKAA
jgi:hypothetical protein